jgi:hypothetical protein
MDYMPISAKKVDLSIWSMPETTNVKAAERNHLTGQTTEPRSLAGSMITTAF